MRPSNTGVYYSATRTPHATIMRSTMACKHCEPGVTYPLECRANSTCPTIVPTREVAHECISPAYKPQPRSALPSASIEPPRETRAPNLHDVTESVADFRRLWRRAAHECCEELHGQQ